jgi:hypothetical protein
MLFEPKIGKLIRKLNPYTNGTMRTMLCGTDPGDLARLGRAITDLGAAITAYAAHNGQNTANLTAIENCEYHLDAALGISDIHLRVDNDYNEGYLTWTFRGVPHKVKRALCVTYRYALPQGSFQAPLYAYDDLLIGYCGSNGG